jgi:biopolymer transport protein ExbD
MADNDPARNDLQQDQAFAQLRARRHRRRDDAEMDITPMIDIVFLLLIFFLVASTPERSAQVDMPVAKYGTPVAGVDAVTLIVQRGDAGSVRVVSETGAPIASGDLEQQRDTITQYVVQGLLAGGGHPKNTVLIKGDRSLKQREVQRVIDAIAQAREQVESLEIFHLGVLETK